MIDFSVNKIWENMNMVKKFSKEATEEIVGSIKKAVQEKNVDLFYNLEVRY